jgi:anti-anti-sigma factor
MAPHHEIRVEATTPSAAAEAEVYIRLIGEFDIATEEELAACLFEACSASRVEVDLTEVSFLDASTARMLVAGCARVRSTGGAFAVGRVDGMPRRVLEMLDVLGYLRADFTPPSARLSA